MLAVRNIAIVVFLCVSLAGAIVAHQRYIRLPDAVSGASGIGDRTMPLPPQVGEYAVIGWQPGLAGYVVKYDERMYRGGNPVSEDGMKVLETLGVKTIIAIAPGDEARKYARSHGMEYVELSFEKGGVIPPEVREAFLKAVRANGEPFYVHGHGGRHRAGVLCALYRLEEQGWDFDAAAIEFGRLGGSLKDDFLMLESIRPKQNAPGR